LGEEPDVGKLLVRFCEGLGNNQSMAQRLWHHRETRRQTENTNIGLQQRKSPVYSTKTPPNLKCPYRTTDKVASHRHLNISTAMVFGEALLARRISNNR